MLVGRIDTHYFSDEAAMLPPAHLDFLQPYGVWQLCFYRFYAAYGGLHRAMGEAGMHIENEELGENVISQVFQKGFKIGDKVVRFAMVQVAN